MAGTPLIIGATQRAALHALRERAAQQPIDMPPLIERLKTPEGEAAHMRQMNDQTVEIPAAYLVTFSIETNHPCGTCRHMSMSVERSGRVPNPHAVWTVAQELGFSGDLKACAVWREYLQRGDERAIAINVVQPLAVTPETTDSGR